MGLRLKTHVWDPQTKPHHVTSTTPTPWLGSTHYVISSHSGESPVVTMVTACCPRHKRLNQVSTLNGSWWKWGKIIKGQVVTADSFKTVREERRINLKVRLPVPRLFKTQPFGMIHCLSFRVAKFRSLCFLFTGCRLCRRPLGFEDSRHRGWEWRRGLEARKLAGSPLYPP